MLERKVNTRDGSIKMGYGWCGGPCRWGTTEKTSALKKHYCSFGGETVVEYVGIAADERQWIKRERNNRSVKLYPLIELDMLEEDCLQYCYSDGWDWLENNIKLYDILDRVSCWCCGNKNKRELYNMWLQLPEYWQKLRELQSQIVRPFKSYGSIFDLEQEFKAGWVPGQNEKIIKKQNKQLEIMICDMGFVV